MPKVTQEQLQARKKEILDACKTLYETKSFKEITLKDIGDNVTCTRTSIYNYFQTKEEIFLAVLKEEYDLWCADLLRFAEGGGATRSSLAEYLSQTLAKRELLLKVLSTNLYDLEDNSRVENLTELKVSYAKTVAAVEQCLQKVEDISLLQAQNFMLAFFPFVFGIYPYTHATEKQRLAMARAKVQTSGLDIYQTALLGIKQLLGV